MSLAFDPWAVEPHGFIRLLDAIEGHVPACPCVTCTFVNLIPTILDATGIDPNHPTTKGSPQ